MAESTASTIRARPLLAAGLDTSLGAEFVQGRIGMLAKTLFLLSMMFFAIGNSVLYLTTDIPPAAYLLNRSSIAQLVATAVLGAVWLLAATRRWSIHALGAVDAGATLACCAAWAIMGSAQPEDVFSALLAIVITTAARAILIPSTGRRTFWLTTLASVPMIVVALRYELPPVPPGVPAPSYTIMLMITVTSALWLASGIALCSVATRTIYGLRREVVEASDIGQYTLEQKIGAGGMGEVWRARHRLLIRPAAVKLIRPQALGSAGDDPGLLLRRFEREARATAALKSPHTVQLHDFGVADDGTLYYVMELLEGLDLDTLVKRFGPLPAERAIHILAQVCESLADAHANGLVHRDIKPANIVVSRVGAAWDFVKVLDFGLVKLAGTRHNDGGVRLTAAGAVSGTPAYMAPEVVLGDAHADHRVDLYALGCVAYWLVTGRLVFEGASGVKVMIAHAQTPPPPPSSRVELPIPAPLEALIMECLEKDPARRPPSAAAVGARLRALGLTMPWPAERAEKWWSVHMPASTEIRPAADVLLSQEARPLRIARRARA